MTVGYPFVFRADPTEPIRPVAIGNMELKTTHAAAKEQIARLIHSGNNLLNELDSDYNAKRKCGEFDPDRDIPHYNTLYIEWYRKAQGGLQAIFRTAVEAIRLKNAPGSAVVQAGMNRQYCVIRNNILAKLEVLDLVFRSVDEYSVRISADKTTQRETTMTTKPKVFLSHISEEAELAKLLRDQLLGDFLHMFDIFLSSDPLSIGAGSKWLKDVSAGLASAQVMLVLCSPESVGRPWINFETGAGWVRDIPVSPLCHTGMRPGDLPIPLRMLQGVSLTDQAGLGKLYHRMATTLGSKIPKVTFDSFIQEVQAFEKEYGLWGRVREAIDAVAAIEPRLKEIFVAKPEHRRAEGDVRDLDLDKMRPHLDVLQSEGMITYELGANKIALTHKGGEGGNRVEITIDVHDAYYQIANKVFSS